MKKYWILYRNIFFLLVPAQLNCMFSSQAGLWTVFTLGGVGSKAAAAPELSSPLANQSLLLLLVLANLTDATDAPNPYRQAIMSFKNTQGPWYLTLWIFFLMRKVYYLLHVIHCLTVVEMTVNLHIFIFVKDET